MKALPTQFDDNRLSNAVATPTCSSCCCCCCCSVATTFATSSLLAQRISREGKKQQLSDRRVLAIIAALFIPISGGIAFLIFRLVSYLLSRCSNVNTYVGESYEVCQSPSLFNLAPILLIIPVLILWFLYSKVHMTRPFKRAILVTLLISLSFTAEVFGGAALILTGVGGIVYLILIPVIVGWISLWYRKHIGKETTEDVVMPEQTFQAAIPTHITYPTPSTTTEHHEENTTGTEEPPQPKPPASGTE